MPLPPRVPTPTGFSQYPKAIYSGGKTQAVSSDNPKSTYGFVGWHIPIGEHETFDAALEAVGHKKVTIRHPRDKGSEDKPYWSFPELTIFPMFAGLLGTNVTMLSRRGPEQATYGVAARWVTLKDSNKNESIVTFLGYLPVGSELFIVEISAKSRMSDELIKALLDHLRVTEAVEKIVGKEFFPGTLKLTLGSSDAEVPFGKAGTVTLLYPVASKHPEEVTTEYAKSISATKSQIARFDAEWDGNVRYIAEKLRTASQAENTQDSDPQAEYAPQPPLSEEDAPF